MPKGQKVNSATLRKFNWRIGGVDTSKVCNGDPFGGIKNCLKQEACAPSSGGCEYLGKSWYFAKVAWLIDKLQSIVELMPQDLFMAVSMLVSAALAIVSRDALTRIWVSVETPTTFATPLDRVARAVCRMRSKSQKAHRAVFGQSQWK